MTPTLDPVELAQMDLATVQDTLKAIVRDAVSVEDIETLRELAQSLRPHAKQMDERVLDRYAAYLRICAERRLGKILASMPIAKGSHGNQHTGRLDGGPNGKWIRLDELGVKKSDSSRAKRLAGIPEAVFDQFLANCLESGKTPTFNGLFQAAEETDN